MKKLMAWLQFRFAREEGQDLIEYALIAALIIVFAAFLLTFLTTPGALEQLKRLVAP